MITDHEFVPTPDSDRCDHIVNDEAFWAEEALCNRPKAEHEERKEDDGRADRHVQR